MRLMILLFSLVLLKGLSAQDIKIQTVNASGSSPVGKSVSVLYTVGEITVPMSASNIGSGFISGANPVKIITSIEPVKELLSVRFFPNPVHDILNVDLTNDLKGYLHWRVVDITGKVISNDRYSTSVSRINFNTKLWSCGTYIVSVSNDQGSILGSYQIIKQ